MRNLHFTIPAQTWDEALPLGNGLMGGPVWSDGHPLNISLDRADLWDTSPVPEFSMPESSYQQLRQWRAEGRTDEITRIYDETYFRSSTTKLPAGRIQVSLDNDAAFAEMAMSLGEALATVK